MEDEVMKELHDIRAEIAREHGNDREKVNTFYENLRFPGFTYGIPGRTFQTEEERDEYIEERNREYARRKARRAASDGMPPPEPR